MSRRSDKDQATGFVKRRTGPTNRGNAVAAKSPFSSTVAEADLRRQRKCVCCDHIYTVADALLSSPTYFHDACHYEAGCWTHCLGCWLGVGPEPDLEDDDAEGNLLRDCGGKLKLGAHLAVMPLARVMLDVPINFGGGVHMYPAGVASLDALNVVPNRENSKKLAEYQSAASRVVQATFNDHATVAFPAEFDWDEIWSTNHTNHMRFIRWLSETVDRRCMDVIRYRQCEIDIPDALPGRAGQLDSNHMMAGALLYNPVIQEARIIGGSAFTHFITRGVGLPITTPREGDFPQDGEVGNIAAQALSLYGMMLETDNESFKFVQALSLLEFMADPDRYQNFEKVSRTVARYVTKSNDEYKRLMDRLFELTGKHDPTTKIASGYRTRIVHIGDRLDNLVPDPDERRKLFLEVDGYIRAVLDHMIRHSAWEFEDYKKVREQMKPFEIR